MSLLAARRGSTHPAGFADPSDVPGLHAWYDAIEGITSGFETTVMAWAVKDGFGPQLEQSTFDNRPRYRDTGTTWSPDPALLFNGGGSVGFRDFMRPGATDYLIPATGPWTVFFLFEISDVTSPATQSLLAQYVGSVGNGRIVFRTEASEARCFLGDEGAHSSVTLSAGTVTDATRHIAVFRRDGADFACWLDGMAGGTHSDADATRSVLQDQPNVGTRGADTQGDPLRGYYGSLLIYHAAVGDADRGNIEGYLSARY